MSAHLDIKGLRALLAGELDAGAESAFRAHLEDEPNCPLCEELFASLSEEEETELFDRLERAELARDPGDAWQAQALRRGGGRRDWRWMLAGALGAVAILLLIYVGVSHVIVESARDDGQRIKGPEAARPAVIGLRAGVIPEDGSAPRALDAARPLPPQGQLVFFVEVDRACWLWLARVGPAGPEGLVGFEGTLRLRLDAGESLLRSGDRALGLELSGLAGEQRFVAGCGSAPSPESLRLKAEGCRSLRLEVEAP